MNVIPKDVAEWAWRNQGTVPSYKKMLGEGFKKHRAMNAIRSLKRWGLIDDSGAVVVPENHTPESFIAQCKEQLKSKCQLQISYQDYVNSTTNTGIRN